MNVTLYTGKCVWQSLFQMHVLKLVRLSKALTWNCHTVNILPRVVCWISNCESVKTWTSAYDEDWEQRQCEVRVTLIIKATKIATWYMTEISIATSDSNRSQHSRHDTSQTHSGQKGGCGVRPHPPHLPPLNRPLKMPNSHIIIIIHEFITRASSIMILNQRCWQSLGGQHGKGVDGLFEKVS